MVSCIHVGKARPISSMAIPLYPVTFAVPPVINARQFLFFALLNRVVAKFFFAPMKPLIGELYASKLHLPQPALPSSPAHFAPLSPVSQRIDDFHGPSILSSFLEIFPYDTLGASLFCPGTTQICKN